jgi:hypothetical protein
LTTDEERDVWMRAPISRRTGARGRTGLALRHESGTYVKFTPAGAKLFA